MLRRADIFAIAIIASGIACAATPASARGTKIPQTVRIEAGAVVDAPRGFVEMCARDPAACTPATLQAIESAFVQDIVTGAIRASSNKDEAIFPTVMVSSAPPLPEIESPPLPVPARFDAINGLPSEQSLRDSPFTDQFPFFGSGNHLAVANKRFSPDPFHLNLAALLSARAPLVMENPPVLAAADSAKEATPAPPSDKTMPLAAMRRLVSRINTSVNRRIIQIADRDRFGTDERWQRAGTEKGSAGDCEDIALEKRAELMDSGIAPNRLLLAIVYTHEVGLHTVLVVRMPDRDVVLDSLKSGIQSRDTLKYSWISIQSPDDPMTWRRVV